MAVPWEVPVTINGVICDLYGRTITGPVKIVGSMIRSPDVGGGPPPDGGGGDKPPIGGGDRPEIWPKPGDPDYPGSPPPEGQPPADASWEWGFSARYNQWLAVYVPGDKPQPPPTR